MPSTRGSAATLCPLRAAKIIKFTKRRSGPLQVGTLGLVIILNKFSLYAFNHCGFAGGAVVFGVCYFLHPGWVYPPALGYRDYCRVGAGDTRPQPAVLAGLVPAMMLLGAGTFLVCRALCDYFS